MNIGILWDLDGTLLDSIQDLTDSVNFALRKYGLPERNVSEILSFVGNGAWRLIQLAMPGTPEDPDQEAVYVTYQEHYRDHCQIKTKPYDGIMEALAVLGEKYPQAVVSNKPDAAAKKLCAQYFPGIYALGESGGCPRKPAPDMVHQAMKDLKLDGCVYVGDSEVDVLTARNAGVPCLSVLWGFRDRKTLLEAGAENLCENTAQLPEMLERIIKEVYGK